MFKNHESFGESLSSRKRFVGGVNIMNFGNLKKWVVKHVRLHWTSWQWNYCDICKFYGNTEIPGGFPFGGQEIRATQWG